MIQPLRQRHRLIVCVLGLLLPVAFAAGLVARKPIPLTGNLPRTIASRAEDAGPAVWTKDDLWPEHPIITTLRRDAAGSVAAELVSPDLAKPDVLVYWTVSKASSIRELPDNARLLGGLRSRTALPLPTGLRGEAGRLLLYSLAEHEVVAVSKSFVLD